MCRAYQLHERDEYRRIGFGIFVKLAFRASLFAERCLGVCLLRDALNVLMWETDRRASSRALPTKMLQWLKRLLLLPKSLARDDIFQLPACQIKVVRYHLSILASAQLYNESEQVHVLIYCSYCCVKAAFHYSSKLQTWLQTWSQTCVSVSQAGRKPAANLLQTWFKPSSNKIDVSGHEETETLHYRLNSISETDTDMMRIALCFQKWKPMMWVDTCSNFRMDVEIDAAGSRPGLRQKKSKACREPARTCRKPDCKPGRKPGLQPGLQVARIMECGL